MVIFCDSLSVLTSYTLSYLSKIMLPCMRKKKKSINHHAKFMGWIKSFHLSWRELVLQAWQRVISGITQGSILESRLFLIYVKQHPKLFADNTKLYHCIIDKNDGILLWDNLNSLLVLSSLWLLKFDARKFIVVKIRVKLKYTYKLPNGVCLKQVKEQRDLVILVSHDLSSRSYILKKAN